MKTIKGAVLCLVSIILSVSGISIDNGRYEDVNIVIQDTVTENELLLERIQEIFTKSSQMLFQATRRHVYFGQINIILPKSWASKPKYTETPARSEADSYITVENGKVKAPHTKRKKKECGYPGWYIYLHTDFLLTEGKTDWGYHESVLVHEWGHLRWGLFEEYGTNEFSRFYLDEGRWNPVRCSKSVTGKVGKGRSCSRGTSKCDANSVQVMNSACEFCPDESQAESNMGSIMAFNWVDGVTLFCDREDDESIPIHQRHNSKAPNKHNVKCNGRSAWEVMRDHDDFNTEPLPENTDTTPAFTILRETDGVRVFVLDVSGSMGGTRIATLYQTCEYIIQTQIPEDSWLSIISFSSSASILKSITQVTSQSVRDGLTGVLPSSASGGTCIGCGIEEALVTLAVNGGVLAGSEIIVISDGEDNGANLDRAIQKAIEANVKIHTISVSQAADTKMISMATDTGGIHISYLEIGTISFASAFFEILASGVTSFATESTTLVSEKIDSLTSNSVSFSFDIDSSIGDNTAVSVLQGASSDISIEACSPSGAVYTGETTGDNLLLTIPGSAETGQYNVTVTTGALSSFEYHVTSLPTDPEVVRVESWITPEFCDFSSGKLPVVEAAVTKGRAEVLNVTVIAVIETGASLSYEVPLHDNGAVPDDIKDDGVYAAVFPPSCIINGRMSAKVYAHAENGTSAVQYILSGAGSSHSVEDETAVLQDSFQRVTVPNEILVSNYVNEDITAPGRITDVAIIDISTENTQYGESRNFTIMWTATGDDVNIGQALEYELRISDDRSILVNSFSAGNSLDIATANFAPKVAGEIEYFRIAVDAEESYTSTTFFGVRAKDESGNVGEVSNIISILVANGYRVKITEGELVDSYSDDSIEDVVTHYISEDITVPGRITDVAIIDISAESTQYGESRNFTITWTATGDDVNIGQALEYELRISDDKSVLVNNFSAANSLDIATANFTPKVAGEIEYVRIEVGAEESYTSTTFFGVRAKDDSGNVGEVSNIISILVANGNRVKITEGELVDSYSDDSIEELIKPEEQKKNLTGLAVGLPSAVAVIVIAIIAVVLYKKKIKAKESDEDCERGCSIEMLDSHDNTFRKQIDANLNSDTKSLTSEQMPDRNISETYDENLKYEDFPWADSELLPGEQLQLN